MSIIKMKTVRDDDKGSYHQFIDAEDGEVWGELESLHDPNSGETPRYKLTYFGLVIELAYFYVLPFASPEKALAWVSDFHRLMHKSDVTVSFSARLEVDLNSDEPSIEVV